MSQNGLAVVTFILTIVLLLIAWVAALKRQIQTQTGIILRRLRREVALEERYRDLFENASDIVYTHDMAGNFTSLNRAGEQCCGYSRSEFLKMNVFQVVAPEELKTVQEKLDSKLGWDQNTPYEVEIIANGGRRVSLEISSRLIYQDGKPVEIHGNARDITERKRVQAELKKAKEAAEAASNAKSEFLANVSHEIRTPMNGILGMTQLVLETPLTPEQSECLNIVTASAESLLAVLNDILDFSKIEARKLDLNVSPFLLRDSLREAIKPLALRAEQKGLETLVEFDDDVPEALLGDDLRLRQIVINLLGNAIKFTEHGSVSIGVSVDSWAGQEITLHFRVRDTGLGIPLEKQRLIFEAFAQADGSTTRRYGGTGLGLSICSRLVAMMHGSICLESELGQGSTFHFTVRLARSDAIATDKGSAALRVSAGVPEWLKGRRVLVADDNAESRGVLVRTLQRWQFRPVAVGSVDAARLELEASAIAENESFAVVLIDAEMPSPDGFWLARRILQNPVLSATPVIMLLTAAGQQTQAVRCRNMGLECYVTKPAFDIDIRSALDRIQGDPKKVVAVVAAPDGHARQTCERPMRLLLAEDNAVNQKLARRLLEKRGHTVVTADNGRVAVEILRRSGFSGFDAVLMDIQMPEMDGFEATATIRLEETSGTRLPIIAMTAHAMKADRGRCLAAGMDGYVTKPIHIDDLLAVMAAVTTDSLTEDRIALSS